MKNFIYYVQIVKMTKERKQKKCNVLKISVGVTKHIPVSSLTVFFHQLETGGWGPFNLENSDKIRKLGKSIFYWLLWI